MNLFKRSNKPELPDDEKVKAAKWLTRIEEARKFDEPSRKQYAIDRKYARGDKGGFVVWSPLAGSYIHILKSFLYARNPDVDSVPSESSEPPPEAEIQKLAKQSVQDDPMAQQELHQIAQTELAQATRPLGLNPSPTQLPGSATVQSPPPNEALSAASNAAHQAESGMIVKRFEEIMAPYIQRMSESKSLGETIERVVRRLWTDAKLRHEAGLFVSSGLTVGAGWLKCTWKDGEQVGVQPMEAFQTTPKKIAGSLSIDFVAAEDIQVSPQAAYLNSFSEAPWIGQRVFMPMSEVKKAYSSLGDRLNSATTYYRRKDKDPDAMMDVGSAATVSAKDADAYRSNYGTETEANGAVWEIWDKTHKKVITLIEGVEGYAKQPYTPDPITKRFYPFFLFAPVEVDGERHPQSLIQRSMSLFDEYARRLSRWSVVCARAIPKTAFDSTLYSKIEIDKLKEATDQEMVGLKPTKVGSPIRDALVPIAYAQIDMNLFEIAPIRAELETVWGIQEALASSIQTPKTATEAQIEQTGSNSRLAFMRSAIDNALSELAGYTAEMALQKLDRDAVQRIAGPWAFWPNGMDADALNSLVDVNIRAGSSGQPDLVGEQQVWARVYPLLRNDIMQIGQLRGSTEEQIADSIEALAEETLRRTGEHMDVNQFMPQAPDTGKKAAPQGPGFQPTGPAEAKVVETIPVSAGH